MASLPSEPPPPATQRSGRLAPPGRLRIDLDAIADNWRRLRGLAAPAAVAGVVKADAYGLGMDRAALALRRAGCSLFFVAGLEEGAALRAVLPDVEIAVLSAPVEGFQAAYRSHRLLPVLNHPGDLAAWPGEDAVLHIDTGMTRLGLDPADAAALDRRRFRLVMSHLACADEPEHGLNEAQRRLFAELAARFDAPASLANSSGIFLGPGYRFDIARPGMALYGLNPTPGRPNPMQPVLRLEARVLQVREAARPLTVGYGAAAEARAGQRLATVAAGYADGYLRAAGPRAGVVLHGRRAPLVGRVSMDSIVVDVTGLPPGAVKPGDWAVLIGEGLDADGLAAAAGTIGYEILTSLGARYARTYTGGGGFGA